MTAIALGIPLAVPGASLSSGVPSDNYGMPTEGPMIDTFGRAARDLRVSLTDRCNLRCTYCMPADGLDWLPGDAVLSADEIIRLITIGVTELGIEAVRFTGGEPLLRKDLPRIVEAVSRLPGHPETSVTTNGGTF